MFRKILLIAGTHGVEPQSRDFAHKLISVLQEKNFKISKAQIGSDPHLKLDLKDSSKTNNVFDLVSLSNGDKEITVIPNLNQWGLEQKTRTNKNGVDLNRNMPAQNWSINFEFPAYNPGPKPASEAETKALLEILCPGNKIAFDLILSLHTTHYVHYHTPPQVNLDAKKFGEGYEFARELASLMQLPLTDDFGHACRGSLGNFCRDHDVPCITIEFEDELTSDQLWQKYSQAFLELLCKNFSKKSSC